MIPRPPLFYTTKNLGPSGPPDRNRRFVHHWPTRGPQDDEIAVFKASDPEAGWTAKDDRALNAYLKVLLEETNDASHLEARDRTHQG
jgi:hypothetical protein